ncbi:MAG: chemotaxis protein CheW [Ignavibacteria bacterium]
MESKFKAVIFSLGQRKYAIGLDAVEHVICSVEITPLPKAPDIILGIVSLHGDIIPVINIRKRLLMPDREISVSDQGLIIKTRRRLCMFVDSVEGCLEIPESEITFGKNIWDNTGCIEGIIMVNNDITLINNPDKFFNPDEEKQIDQALNIARGND